MDNDGGGGGNGREWGMAAGGVVRGKGRKVYLNNNKIKINFKKRNSPFKREVKSYVKSLGQ